MPLVRVPYRLSDKGIGVGVVQFSGVFAVQ